MILHYLHLLKKDATEFADGGFQANKLSQDILGVHLTAPSPAGVIPSILIPLTSSKRVPYSLKSKVIVLHPAAPAAAIGYLTNFSSGVK